MAKFRVLKPVAVTIGKGENAVVKHYREPGVEVELDDATAAPLVEQGRVEAVEAVVAEELPEGNRDGEAPEGASSSPEDGAQKSEGDGDPAPATEGAKPRARNRG